MSDENEQNDCENDISMVTIDQQNTTPQSSPTSSTSSQELSNSTEGGALMGGIVEVSDDNKDVDEVEEEDIQVQRRSHMPLRRSQVFLMECGHPAPPDDRSRIKKWAANGRNWCQTCNPLTTRNLIKGSNMLSGWRKTMEQLIEKNVFPLSVLNLNDTYVYGGNNGHETTMLPVVPNGHPFMLDLDVFLGIICANDLCRLPLRALTCLRSFIHSDTRVIPFFEKIHPQSLCHFSVNLLETAIRLMEDPTEQSEIAFRRSKTALQCFYHMVVRMPFFRETICKHQLSHWLNLLRIEFLRNDIILSIVMTIKEMHAAWFRSDDLYVRLLSDLLLLYGSPNASSTEPRAFIIHIFTVLFYTDPSFIYDSYRLMDRETFTELLSVIESALNFAPVYRLRDFDYSIPPKACLHPNNLAFCLELFEIIDRELAECRASKFDVGIRLTILVHIINLCSSSSRDVYNDVLNKGSAISLISSFLKALMFAQREYGAFLVRAQNFIRSGTNPGNAKIRYEAQQRGTVKSRPIKERVQSVQSTQQKRHVKVASMDYDSNGTYHTVEDSKTLQDANITSTDQYHQFGSKTQHIFDPNKRDWQTEKESEFNSDIQDLPLNENGDEPRKKHARLHSGSESNDSPVDGNPADEPSDSIQVDDSADAEMEEIKPLLSPSDVSCSSSSDEAPPPVSNQRSVRPPMAKVNPMSNNPSFVAKSGANCFEEMDEEEEESDEEIESQDTESIFAPGAENMFEEYMTKRAPDFDSNSLNEDELLRGLPFFRSIHQVYQLTVTRSINQQFFMTLKQSTLKAIDNLCRNSVRNKMIAGRLDAIPLILQCSMRQDNERMPTLQLGIFALRALCLDCIENQERLLDITEGCADFIDRQRLFTSMGVEVSVDKSGKPILVPVDEK